MAEPVPRCTVRLHPVPASTTHAAILQELQCRGLHTYLQRLGLHSASAAFQDPCGPDGSFAADLYFASPAKAKAAVPFLGSFDFFQGTAKASLVSTGHKQDQLRPQQLSVFLFDAPASSTLPINPSPQESVQPDSATAANGAFSSSPVTPKTRALSNYNSPTLSRFFGNDSEKVFKKESSRSKPPGQYSNPKDAGPARSPGSGLTQLNPAAPAYVPNENGVMSAQIEQGKSSKLRSGPIPAAELTAPIAVQIAPVDSIGAGRVSGTMPHSPSVATTPDGIKYKAEQSVVFEPVPKDLSSQAISEEVKRALAVIDAKSRTDLVRGLQSCSASLSTAQWLNPFAYLNFRDAVEARQAAVLLSREPLFKKQIRAVVKSDLVGRVSDQPYVNGGSSLKAVDEAVYRQAGVLLYRKLSTGIEALLDTGPAGITILCGPRQPGEGSVKTASRVLKEKTAVSLDIERLLKTPGTGVQVAWEVYQEPLGIAGAVLYMVDAAIAASSQHSQTSLRSYLPLNLLAAAGSVSICWPSGALSPVSPTLQQWAAKLTANHSDLLTFKQKVLAAKSAVEKEKPVLMCAIAELRKPIPPYTPRIPTDLLPLQEGTREHTDFLKQWASIPAGKIRQIKRVENTAQSERFARYAASIGQGDPSRQLKLLHGTRPVANANSIARKGPNISLAGSANGKRLGQGFYTAETPEVVVSYAGDQGAICVCTAAPGVMRYGGNENVSAATLAAEGFHSVVKGDWHVIFHPDAVRVDFVVDFGTDDTVDARKGAAEQDAREKHALNAMVRAQEACTKQNRVAMGEYFAERCAAAVEGLEGLGEEKLALRRKLFEREAQQYKQALPMYAFKNQFLDSLKGANGLVLQGGTGVGKSVMVPQWLYDHVFVATGFGHRRVAVLVPRRAIAETLAVYISEMRGCEIGEEVGLGIDGDVRMSRDSQLIFMTYGFFRAISVNDPNFSQWGAVILDEAHEGKNDSASIFARLGAACRARPEFLAIVMSATIDLDLYSAALVAGGMPRAPSKLKVEGVTYPVKQVWWDGEPWRPSQENALADLALETVRIVNKEPEGNVLVFLSTTGAVMKTVEELKKLLAHQPGVLVYPLYAAMTSDDKDRVTSFGDLTRFPNHAKKRLLCVATNIAEAGITIADVSTVIETGWEMEMVFDHVTKRTSAREVRISRASHAQRRGRAGRTRPGTCYSIYSAADFTAFPEYGTPEILRSNLENFALGMLAAGLDPLTLALVEGDRARERLLAAVERLRTFRALSGAPSGKLSITELGRKLARLPLDLNLALCVLAAADARLACSNEVAIIACVAQMASLNLFDRGDSGKAAKTRFAAPSGDHETYLAVFEAWIKAGKQSSWCQANGIHGPALLAADDLLTKLQAGMKAARVPVLSLPPGTNRRQAILRALCAGYATQTAVPFSTDAVKAGYLVTSEYVTNPTIVLQHPACSVQGPGGPLLLFQSGTVTSDGREMLLGMSRVEQGWVEEALTFDAATRLEFVRTMQIIARKRYEVPVSLATNKQVTAFMNNLEDLRKAFPTVRFSFAAAKSDSKLTLHAPVAAWPAVEARVKALINNLELETRSVPLTHVSPPTAGLLKHLRDDVMESLDTTCELTLVAGPALNVTTFKLVIEPAVAAARRRLGILTPLPTPRGVLGEPEQERLRAVQSGSKDGIVQMFGSGKLGSMLLLARLILESDLQLWIYGGFIRDVIVRGDAHSDADLDVGIPTGESAQACMDEVARLAAAAGMRYGSTKLTMGPKVVAYYFETLDGTQRVEVQVVDAHHFMQKDPRIDFDVNNLKMEADGKLAMKYALENRDVTSILSNIRTHTLVVLKPALEVSDRIDKMRKRGWNVTFPNAKS